MKIDWKTATFNTVLPPIDWDDPTHVPLMLAECVEEIGNCASTCFYDNEGEPLPELLELELMVIDLMPSGEAAIRQAVQERVRQIAIAEGWEDALYEPGTTKYPWE